MDLLDAIPGYRAAIERESAVRNAAFIDVTESICGIDVEPLTLRRFIMLDGLGSPFVNPGRRPTLADCVQFMWAVSPQFNPRRKGLRRHIRKCKNAGHVSLALGILAYIREAMQDAPGVNTVKGFSPSYYSWACSIVDVLASEYHWSEASILDMPMKRIFQYYKRLTAKSDPKAILFNPSDKVRSAWLKTRNQQPKSN